MQSLCTLRNHCRQWPRNTRYQAGAHSLLGPDFHRLDGSSFAWRTHSITSSARARSAGGTVEAERPRGFEVRRRRSNFGWSAEPVSRRVASAPENPADVRTAALAVQVQGKLAP